MKTIFSKKLELDSMTFGNLSFGMFPKLQGDVLEIQFLENTKNKQKTTIKYYKGLT